MSYSAVYKVYKTKTTVIEKFRNSHGSAPPLWDMMGVKYLNRGKNGWLCVDQKENKKLWDLAIRQDVAKHLRIAMAWTFDFSICPSDRLNELADACAQTGQDITEYQDSSYVNHWPIFAGTLRAIFRNRLDRRLLGIGLCCTSVSDPWIDYGRERRKPMNLFDVFNEDKTEEKCLKS